MCPHPLGSLLFLGAVAAFAEESLVRKTADHKLLVAGSCSPHPQTPMHFGQSLSSLPALGHPKLLCLDCLLVCSWHRLSPAAKQLPGVLPDAFLDLGSSHHANKRWQDPSGKPSHISWKQVKGEKATTENNTELHCAGSRARPCLRLPREQLHAARSGCHNCHKGSSSSGRPAGGLQARRGPL